MSTSDDGTITVTPSSSGEGVPAKRYRRCEISVISQETAASLFDGGTTTNGYQVEQFDMVAIHEKLLTNMETFFDEPVWRMVLGKLVEKPDVDNCSSASPFFWNLLRDKVVLKEVFGILARRYYDQDNKDEVFKETNVESIPWQRSTNRPLTDWMTGILKCRLVSKKWNKAIEEIHRNEEAGHYRMRWDFEEAENEQICRMGGGINMFDMELEVANFLSHFEATHYDRGARVAKKCPFLARFVVVKYIMELVENTEAYFNSLMEMFKKFGNQVNYFWFYWRHTELAKPEDHVFIYLKLKEMVELMPNLKVLRIEYRGFKPLDLPGLEEEMQSNPFPERTNLEMISADQIPGVLCNHLVIQNRRISRLEIDEIHFNGNCLLFTHKLPNLSHLSLAEMNSMEILEAFERYPATLNLKKFHFHCVESCPFVPFSRVFNVIGSKLNPGICTDLLLQMPESNSHAEKLLVLEESLSCRLKLANIQRCEVISFDRVCLDFLLASKNTLREIKIELCCALVKDRAKKGGLRGRQVIKFLGCEENLELSNIGEELPALRKLEVQYCERKICRHYAVGPNGVVKVEKEDKLS